MSNGGAVVPVAAAADRFRCRGYILKRLVVFRLGTFHGCNPATTVPDFSLAPLPCAAASVVCLSPPANLGVKTLITVCSAF